MDETWVKITGNIATLGIKEESAKAVDEFMFVKLPVVGTKLNKGDIYVSLEAIKWSGHIETPIAGEVIEVNEKVYDTPSLINDFPTTTWICKLKID